MKDKIKIFGILNVTPDSFSDGGKFFDLEVAMAQAEQLFFDAADYVDVGGQSTRPGAEEIEWKEEWERVRGVIEILLEKYPGRISLDTKNWQTAERFLELVQSLSEELDGNECISDGFKASQPLCPNKSRVSPLYKGRGREDAGGGSGVLNDVSGFQDPRMIEMAVQFQPLCIVNHFPGKNINIVHEQKIDSINQVRDDLFSRKEELLIAGIPAEKIILDPGIGFGKTMELNWELLKFPSLVPDEKVLIGHSKKRFLGEKRFESASNLEAAKIAIQAGAWGIRVHEVSIYQPSFISKLN